MSQHRRPITPPGNRVDVDPCRSAPLRLHVGRGAQEDLRRSVPARRAEAGGTGGARNSAARFAASGRSLGKKEDQFQLVCDSSAKSAEPKTCRVLDSR